MLASLADEKRYLAMASQYDERTGRLDAELVPGVQGRWHIVRVEGGRETTAAAHLVGRRFGVYLPQYPEVLIVRGRKIERLRNLFPGYLFVFVWDVMNHAGRILAVPGVIDILSRNDHPVVVPDAMIDDIRRREESEWPLVTTMDVVRVRRRRRKYAHVHESRQLHVRPQDIVSVRAAGWIKGITDLDDEERISKLNDALGLAL